jgi:hypothetical protein
MESGEWARALRSVGLASISARSCFLHKSTSARDATHRKPDDDVRLILEDLRKPLVSRVRYRRRSGIHRAGHAVAARFERCRAGYRRRCRDATGLMAAGFRGQDWRGCSLELGCEACHIPRVLKEYV